VSEEVAMSILSSLLEDSAARYPERTALILGDVPLADVDVPRSCRFGAPSEN
jgi:hypothetical protein